MQISRVLMIEDQVSNQLWLRQALQQAFGDGLEIRLAENLAQAKTQLRAAHFDLSLIDLGLPDGNGLSLLTDYASPLGCKVITTIFDDDDHVFEALKLGVDGYVIKTAMPGDMANLLTGLVEGRPPISNVIAKKLLASFSSPNRVKTKHLTEREVSVLTELARGLSVKQIAQTLNLAPNTVSGYVKTIYQKLNINSKAQAAVIATAENLI